MTNVAHVQSSTVLKWLAEPIRNALRQNEVVVVRDSGIHQNTHEAATELTELFECVGRVWTTDDELAKESRYQLPRFPAIIVLQHDGLLGSKALRMHSDLSHHPARPYPCRALYAHKLPEDHSGSTSFYSCYEFADMLREDGLLDEYRKYVAWHGPAYDTGWAGRWNRLIEMDPFTAREWIAYDDAFIKTIAKLTTVNGTNVPTPMMLSDMEREEFKAKLNPYRDNLIPYVHDWEPGDIVIWQNRGVLHSREALGPGQERTMFRITFDFLG